MVTQPILEAEALLVLIGGHKSLAGRVAVIRMYRGEPTEPLRFLFRLASKFIPGAVEIGAIPVRVGDPHHQR